MGAPKGRKLQTQHGIILFNYKRTIGRSSKRFIYNLHNRSIYSSMDLIRFNLIHWYKLNNLVRDHTFEYLQYRVFRCGLRYMARLRLLFKYYNNINIDRLYAKLLYTVGHNISVFTDLYKRGYRSLLRNYKLESRLKLQRIVRSDIGSKGSS